MSPFLSEAARTALLRLVADDAGEEAPEGLTRLRDIRAVLGALETDDATLAAVREAISTGSSWQAIAEAAGLGPAAAKWRWQGGDDEIAARHAAGRARSARPSSVPTDLPGLSVTQMAEKLGVSPQAIYQRITRGLLTAMTVELPDGRRYKRVVDEPGPGPEPGEDSPGA